MARIKAVNVISAVAKASDVPVDRLLNSQRAQTVALPRQMAMFLMAEYCPHLSMPQIAASLARKDHTTVLHGISRWRNTWRQQSHNYDLEQRARAILVGSAAQQNTQAVDRHASPPPRAHGLGRLPFASAVTASVTLSGVRPRAPEGDGLDSHRQASPRREASPLPNSPAGAPKPAGASSGKNTSAGKAKGGRKSAQSARNYYHTFGGRPVDHERARRAAEARQDGTCMACDSAGQIDGSGLCTDCAGRVQRVAPAAAYGGERGNLSRTSAGIEADNIITTDAGA